MAPPSIHPSGEPYKWDISLDSMPLAALPESILAVTPSDKTPVGELLKGVPEGERNNALARLTGKLLQEGWSLEEVLQFALTWNQLNKPPLPEKEVQKTVQSIHERHTNNHTDSTSAAIGGLISLNSFNSYSWPVLKPEALYGLAGDVVGAIEPHSEADPAALLINVLVSFGNVIGDGPHFMAEADRHPMRLFAICVGETSKGRKGISWGHIERLFKAVDPEWANGHVLSGLSSGEGLIWAVRDPIEKKEEIIDEGIHDKRLLVLESEFSSVLRVLRREGNILSAVIRQAWDNGNLRTLTKNSPAKATGAHISILGHITKDELRRYLDSTEAGNGFGNRFLWVCVRRSKVLPEGGGHVDLESLAERLREALAFARTAGQIRRDDTARLVWHEVYGPLSEGKPGMFGSLTARAEAQVMRLACIYALLDISSVVRKEHLLAALSLWDYCEASVRYIFGSATGDYVADRILVALEQAPEGLSLSKIHSLFSRNLKAEQISRVLTSLLSTGAIKRDIKQTDGRSAEVFSLLEPSTK